MLEIEPVAVIDLGTNTSRLLVTDGEGLDMRVNRITGLGRGLHQTGSLSADAVIRVLEAIGEFKEIIDANGAEKVRAIATSAARDARNRSDLFAPAAQILGQEIELLPGEEEARYGFVGATMGLETSNGPFLVVDIGGGSTEFSYGSEIAELFRSVDMGAVRYFEKYLQTDPPKPEELSAAIQVARLHLDDIDREQASMGKAPTLVAVAGTATTIAAVELGLDPYDRAVVDGFRLTRSAAEDVFRTLATEPMKDRIHNPGLEEARADVIVAGCCILVAIMRHWEFDYALVKESDLLDGIAKELLEVS